MGERGVGLAVQDGGVLLVVVDGAPDRVAAVAEVAWPEGPPARRWRMLGRARRRLRLARWHPVAVVAAGAPDQVAATMTTLARAGLVATGTVDRDDAALSGTARVAVDPALAVALARPGADLALGAARAMVRPAPRPPVAPGTAVRTAAPGPSAVTIVPTGRAAQGCGPATGLDHRPATGGRP
jgi:hypothetical protein